MFRREAVCDKLFKSCETISIDHVYISPVTVQGFSYLYQIGPLNLGNRPAHEITVKPVLSGHSKIDHKLVSRRNIAQCRSKVLQNAPREHSAIITTFINLPKLPFVVKTLVLSIFEGPLKNRPQIGFQDGLLLNEGQKYSAILSISLSYYLLLRPWFCLFLSGCFTQVLLYGTYFICIVSI